MKCSHLVVTLFIIALFSFLKCAPKLQSAPKEPIVLPSNPCPDQVSFIQQFIRPDTLLNPVESLIQGDIAIMKVEFTGNFELRDSFNTKCFKGVPQNVMIDLICKDSVKCTILKARSGKWVADVTINNYSGATFYFSDEVFSGISYANVQRGY